jgi:tRNA threonylcarbamoyladenosine biosynthesis protein TsaB
MLLAIDTSTAQMGLAVFDGAQVLGESMWTSRQHHTVELAPSVQELLKRCGIPVDALGCLGVALGPGSFTSLRVGLSFAKGLAMARRLPLVGIPTLDVVAASQMPAAVPLVAVLQAGRGRLAVGWYKAAGDGWQADGPAKVETAESLANSIRHPTIVCGELHAEERRRLKRKRVNVVLSSAANSVRRPALLAELAWSRWQAGSVDDAAALAPIYLHSAEPVPG